MKKIFTFATISFCLIIFSQAGKAQSDSLITFSEIMFNPVSGNNEFIELYNTSETDSIDLANFKIKYYTSNPDGLVSTGLGTKIPPKGFAVIFEGDYDIASGVYKNIVPISAIILKIAKNYFGSSASGMAGSNDRELRLISSAGDTIETYLYSSSNGTGISDEKKILTKDNAASNWANSLQLNGTPGFKNSISPLSIDLAVSSISISPSFPLVNSIIEIGSVLKNFGISPVQNFTAEIYLDTNKNSLGEQTEKIFEQTLSLNSNDSTTISYQLQNLVAGNYQIIVSIKSLSDENQTNNIKIATFTVYPKPNSLNDLVVNEIMYAPITGEPEWVEFFNRSDKAINLKKWKISDNATPVAISAVDVFVPAKGYIVLSKDSTILSHYSVSSPVITLSLPALNNTDDAVVLKDSLNILIDSLYYFSTWGGSNGRSLERLNPNEAANNPSNWKTSIGVFKATPGAKNSIVPLSYDVSVSSVLFAPLYPAINDEVTITSLIKNTGDSLANPVTAEIFLDANNDSTGQSNELLFSNSYSLLSQDSIVIEKKLSGLTSGTHHILVQALFSTDENQSNNKKIISFTVYNLPTKFNDVVVNEIMYAPLSGEPEWIELFNRTDSTINLKKWRIGDNATQIILPSNDFFITKHSYAIVAKDSSLLNLYKIASPFIVASLPSLNNTDDAVVLKDSLNTLVDSLYYFSNWGGSNGRSLERIDANQPALNPSNWKTSTGIAKATPGKINSVTRKDYDGTITDILFSPNNPVTGDNISFSAKVKNPGINDLSFHLELYLDENLDSIPDAGAITSDSFTLTPLDSLTVPFNYVYEKFKGTKGFFVKGIFAQDDDTTNNSFYKTLSAGFPSGSVLLNEVMFTPANSEPEWVEVFNASNDTINLKDWTINDVYTTPAYGKVTTDFILLPQTFGVLAKDSSIINYHRTIPSKIVKINLPVLNNDVDGVVLKDNRAVVMDSLLYNSSWGGSNGYSLERKLLTVPANMQDNWASSLDIEQSTPGRINSQTPKDFDLTISNLATDLPSFGENENFPIYAGIKNIGTKAVDNFSIQFYIDTDSNHVAEYLFDTQAVTMQLQSGDSLKVIAGVKGSISRRILFAAKVVFTADEDTLNNYVEKYFEPGYRQQAIVINEVMYNPNDNAPEWIELLARDSVNLKNWSISDSLSTPVKVKITYNDFYLSPNEFVVLSKDSISFFNAYHLFTNAKFIPVNLPSLSNTEDGVHVYDFRDALIDRMHYKSTWAGKKGFSIEHISGANDSLSWITSLAINGNSAGGENLLPNQNIARSSIVINEIMFDPDIDNSEFIEFQNISNDSINIGGWRIQDEKGNFYKLSETGFIIPPGEFFLLAADSIVLQKYPELSSFLNLSVANESSLGFTNTGELIQLKNIFGAAIDSIVYSDKWHNKNIVNTKNKSLERINPNIDGNSNTNWSTSVAVSGATPGKQNSIFTTNSNTSANISVSPNPFSPDNDGFEDFTIINYNLSQAISQTRIKIFDSKGRLVRTLNNNQPSAQTGSVVFNGLDDDGNPLRIGIYIVYLEAMNDASSVVDKLKTVVVVARKL
ncbi:MAG: lamin tail domain-containing protein [Ignavibacteria bacterium]|nr:lamin tail domain-containing protein [Ignavibacteria bacterium]